MICIGTTSVGERCKQYRIIPSNYCKRHDPERISVYSSDNERDNSDLDFTLSDLDNLSDDISEPSKLEFIIPEHQNLGVINVKGDGYCFWRALSLCLYGNQNSYSELSEKCINEKSDDEIVSSKWVEFHEIPIISKILGITINIVHYMEEEIYLYICLPSGEIENKIYPCEMNPSETEVYIYYVPGHYTSIVKI